VNNLLHQLPTSTSSAATEFARGVWAPEVCEQALAFLNVPDPDEVDVSSTVFVLAGAVAVFKAAVGERGVSLAVRMASDSVFVDRPVGALGWLQDPAALPKQLVKSYENFLSADGHGPLVLVTSKTVKAVRQQGPQEQERVPPRRRQRHLGGPAAQRRGGPDRGLLDAYTPRAGPQEGAHPPV
jgi:hypothetical protein